MAPISHSNAHGLRRLSSADSTTPALPKTLDDGVLREQTIQDVTDSDDTRYSEDQFIPRNYRVYRSRFVGLAQLVLLNIVISWDWLTFAAISSTASEFFDVSESTVNWLSTTFLFAFAASAPLTIWILNQYGPKGSMLVASGLTLAGNWVRYAGTRTDNGNFSVVMVGQILIGLAQPFALAAPTRYSNLWFSDSGRITATAVASLANPFGAALGQLIGPLMLDGVTGVPNMVLYTAIISSVASLPAPFIPAKPPTPPSATASIEMLNIRDSLQQLPSNGSLYLVLIPFAVFVGCFNATSSLINQIFEPYGFSETEAGIAGGILIIVGLITSAVISPIFDRKKAYVKPVKIIIPVIAACYVVLIWMPGTRTLPGPYLICALLGATSFTLLPVALELLSVLTLPVSPEVSSVIAWSGGQVFGAVLILIMDAFEAHDGWNGEPKGTLKKALIFQAGIACLVVPLPLLLRTWKFRQFVIGSDGLLTT